MTTICLDDYDVSSEVCGICGDPAKKFCVDCQVKLCKKHKRDDRELQSLLRQQEHYRVTILSFVIKPSHYVRTGCSSHKGRPITHACKSCLKIFCADCNHTGSCELYTGKRHQIQSFDEILQIIKARICEKQRVLSNKSSLAKSLERDVRIKLDNIQSEFADMMKAVDDALTSQSVSGTAEDILKDESENLKQRIKEYINQRTRQTSVYADQLAEQAKSYDFFSATLTGLLQFPAPEALMLNYCKMEQKLDSVLVMNVEHYQPVSKKLINQDTPERTALGLALVEDYSFAKLGLAEQSRGQSALRFDRSIKSEHHSYWSVRFMSEDRLITSGHNGTTLKNFLEKVPGDKVELACECHHIIPYKDKFIILLRDFGIYRIQLFSNDLNFIKTIAEIPPAKYWAHLAVTSDGYIVAIDGAIKSLEVMSVTDGQKKTSISLSHLILPYGVCITPDNQHVLVSDFEGGSVEKFDLKTGQSVWKTDELDSPSGIAEYNGMAYVGCGGESLIYQLDISNGKLSRIPSIELPEWVCDISICNGKLAVVSNSKSILLFTLTASLGGA